MFAHTNFCFATDQCFHPLTSSNEHQLADIPTYPEVGILSMIGKICRSEKMFVRAGVGRDHNTQSVNNSRDTKRSETLTGRESVVGCGFKHGFPILSYYLSYMLRAVYVPLVYVLCDQTEASNNPFTYGQFGPI